jgi:hypothetical protein
VRLLAFDYREDKKEIRMFTQIYPETLWQVIASRAATGNLPHTPHASRLSRLWQSSLS